MLYRLVVAAGSRAAAMRRWPRTGKDGRVRPEGLWNRGAVEPGGPARRFREAGADAALDAAVTSPGRWSRGQAGWRAEDSDSRPGRRPSAGRTVWGFSVVVAAEALPLAQTRHPPSSEPLLFSPRHRPPFSSEARTAGSLRGAERVPQASFAPPQRAPR